MFRTPYPPRTPWTAPLPLWPVVAGPLLGLAGSRLLTASAHASPALGFGAGMFVGLLACLGIMLAHRRLAPETLLVAVAALVVLASLVGRPWP